MVFTFTSEKKRLATAQSSRYLEVAQEANSVKHFDKTSAEAGAKGEEGDWQIIESFEFLAVNCNLKRFSKEKYRKAEEEKMEAVEAGEVGTAAGKRRDRIIVC